MTVFDVLAVISLVLSVALYIQARVLSTWVQAVMDYLDLTHEELKKLQKARAPRRFISHEAVEKALKDELEL